MCFTLKKNYPAPQNGEPRSCETELDLGSEGRYTRCDLALNSEIPILKVAVKRCRATFHLVILLIAGATGTRNRGVCCLVPRLYSSTSSYSASDFVVIVARDRTGLTEGSQTVFESPVFKHRGFSAVSSEWKVIQWT